MDETRLRTPEQIAALLKDLTKQATETERQRREEEHEERQAAYKKLIRFTQSAGVHEYALWLWTYLLRGNDITEVLRTNELDLPLVVTHRKGGTMARMTGQNARRVIVKHQLNGLNTDPGKSYYHMPNGTVICGLGQTNLAPITPQIVAMLSKLAEAAQGKSTAA